MTAIGGPTLGEFFERLATVHGDQSALVCDDQRVSFAELDERIKVAARGLFSSGVRAGDRVAVLSGNSVGFVVVFGAVARLGAIFVPLNYRLTLGELRVILADAEARLILVSPEHLDMATNLSNHAVLKPLNDLLHDPSPGSEEIRATLLSDLDTAALIYTAAVDAEPRGAMMSHRAFVSQAFNQAAAIGLVATDRFAVLTPLLHTAALSYAMSFLAVGASAVLASRFDPIEAVELIDRHAVTVLFGFAPMPRAILESARDVPGALSTLRLLLGRDEPDVIRGFMDLSPDLRWMVGNYGQTETHGMAVGGASIDRATLDASDFTLPGGRQLPMSVAHIVDDAGNLVPPGVAGEIVVRGPNVATGYWRRPEASAHALRGDWWHTGDLGRMDDRGHLHFVARKAEKDLIKTGGENVYPAEVEAVLLEHPAVSEAIVFGVHDPVWTEAVKAVIVVVDHSAAVDADTLIGFCGERIARYKRPRSIEFISAMPRSATGEVSREDVKRRYGK